MPQEGFQVGGVLAGGIEADVEMNAGEPLLEPLKLALQVLIPFAGFGDPQLSDSPVGNRNRTPSAAALFPTLNVEPIPSRQPDVADVRAIKRAPSLPETADELRAMAKTLKAGDGSLWLRDKATETNVKNENKVVEVKKRKHSRIRASMP